MLFSAGVGIGIFVFLALPKPMFLFLTTPSRGVYPNNPFADQIGATEMNEQRAIAAMRVDLFPLGLSRLGDLCGCRFCLWPILALGAKLPLTLRFRALSFDWQ